MNKRRNEDIRKTNTRDRNKRRKYGKHQLLLRNLNLSTFLKMSNNSDL